MTTLTPRKIAIFDIDGTLVIESKRLRAQAEAVSSKFGSTSAELQAVIYAFFSVNDFFATTDTKNKHNIPLYMQMIGEKLGSRVTSEEAAVLATLWTDAYVYSHTTPELFPDVVPCLTVLSQRGFELIIASGNTYASRVALLQTTGIAHFFTQIYAATDMGFQKQDICFWQQLITDLSITPDDSVAVIGNQLNDDICNPIKLGLAAFLIEREDEFKKVLDEPVVVPTAVVSNLVDMLELPYFA